jgi:hypothetical protein
MIFKHERREYETIFIRVLLIFSLLKTEVLSINGS